MVGFLFVDERIVGGLGWGEVAVESQLSDSSGIVNCRTIFIASLTLEIIVSEVP